MADNSTELPDFWTNGEQSAWRAFQAEHEGDSLGSPTSSALVISAVRKVLAQLARMKDDAAAERAAVLRWADEKQSAFVDGAVKIAKAVAGFDAVLKRAEEVIAQLPATADGKPIIPLITPIYALCEVGDSEFITPTAVVSGVICGTADPYNGGWTIRGTGPWNGMEFEWFGMGTRSPWCSSPEVVETELARIAREIDANLPADGPTQEG